MHQREFNRPMPVPLPDVVNDRAGRLMKGGEPRVIPWAAWAEFSQRHIAMAIADTDHHYRRTLALPDRADELNDDMNGVLVKLRMFSVASTSRRVGKAATEADVTYLREALEVLASSPELIPISYWTFFETAAAHEQLPGRVPPSRSWFAAPSAEVPYDAGDRLRDRAPVIPVRAHEALVEAAPSDVWVLATARTRRPSSPALVARANTLVAERAGYDLWAVDIAANATETREEWEKYLRRGCELSPNRCLNLARRLSETDEQAAAAEFERALANP